MGIEKRFNSLCMRLRRRFGIKNGEEHEEDYKKVVSEPDLIRGKSWRKPKKKGSKAKTKGGAEKDMGVSLARFDEDVVRQQKRAVGFEIGTRK